MNFLHIKIEQFQGTLLASYLGKKNQTNTDENNSIVSKVDKNPQTGPMAAKGGWGEEPFWELQFISAGHSNHFQNPSSFQPIPSSTASSSPDS